MRALHSLGAATTASLLLLLLVSLLLAAATRGDGEGATAVKATAAAAAANSPNITAVTRRRGAVGPNSTSSSSSMHILGVSLDASVLRRAAYFCLGVVAVLGFFAALRMRRRFRKPRKYGVIVTPADEVEMDPLADDLGDEDEDTTLFEAKRQR
ncbi:membrane protein FAM174B-like [Lethenteron reissneri]|uniref:membrane protein FAM174B-like n=1 Tax=Lethenteron reissneri TaxID=7753 RepID=UPI002AB6CF8A|nr:membrane protein FAM174B-like [Lethenteron reissneri]